MPELVNRLDHGVRVTTENGRETRLRPGQVKSVDGEAADLLSGIEGVDSASSDDKEAWEKAVALHNGQTTNTTGGKMSLEASVTAARTAARHAAIAVPLNQVVGDNDAPLGPPSGVITTKQAVARQDPAHKAAFADHERLPEEADADNGLSEVEQAQAEAAQATEELHNEVLTEAQEAGNEAVDLEPQLSGTLTTDSSKSGSRRRRRRSSSDDSEPAPSE